MSFSRSLARSLARLLCTDRPLSYIYIYLRRVVKGTSVVGRVFWIYGRAENSFGWNWDCTSTFLCCCHTLHAIRILFVWVRASSGAPASDDCFTSDEKYSALLDWFFSCLAFYYENLNCIINYRCTDVLSIRVFRSVTMYAARFFPSIQPSISNTHLQILPLSIDSIPRITKRKRG